MDAAAPDRHRTITWHDPVETAVQAQGLPGLEFLHRLTSGLIPAAPVTELVGLRSTYVMPGRVVFEYEPREEHYNGLGAVDAGILTTVLDSAMAAAVQSLLAADCRPRDRRAADELRPPGHARAREAALRGRGRPFRRADGDGRGATRRRRRRALRERILDRARAASRAKAVARGVGSQV